MDFVHTDLGQLNAGDVVVVTLANQANFRLLDSTNFAAFRSGMDHRGVLGHATRSPLRLRVPSHGHWHLVLDLGGHAGTIRSSVRVVKAA